MNADAIRFEAVIAQLSDQGHREFVRDLRRKIVKLEADKMNLQAVYTQALQDLEDERREHRRAPAAPIDDARRNDDAGGDLPTTSGVLNIETFSLPTPASQPSPSSGSTLSHDFDPDFDSTVERLGSVDLSHGEGQDNRQPDVTRTDKGKRPEVPLDMSRSLPRPARRVSFNATPGPSSVRRCDKRPLADIVGWEDTMVHRSLAKRPRSMFSDAARERSTDEPDVRVLDGPKPKLNIRRFVAANTRSIWDKVCDITLPQLQYDGTVYETGDIVVLKSDGAAPSGSALDGGIGVLCNWSTANPFPDSGDFVKFARPRHDDGVVSWILIMWLMDPTDIHYVVNEAPDASKSDIADESRDLWQFDNSLKSLAEQVVNLPRNRLFLSTDMDWVPAIALGGHLSPYDVGLASQGSNRRLIIDWQGPVITAKEKWLCIPGDNEQNRLWYIFSVNKGSYLKKDDVPDGWVYE
ncbi:unnamed protein product [Peniophora sp. CBMAI 1063]|nr:unnamed protein product [Peniophora sp. CBMAI 1063]